MKIKKPETADIIPNPSTKRYSFSMRDLIKQIAKIKVELNNMQDTSKTLGLLFQRKSDAQTRETKKKI